LVVMTGLAATGGLIHFVLPPGTGHSHTLLGLGRHDFGQIHFYLAVAVVVLLAIHVLLHWSWVCCAIAKMADDATPSRRAQTTWGLALLLGVVLILGGGLFWASSTVEQTATGRGGSAQLDRTSRRGRLGPGVLDRVGEAINSQQATGEQELAVSPPGGPTRPKRSGVHEKHLEDCPAGATINGRISFMDASRTCGVSVEQLRQHLALPREVDHSEQLGRLKRRYGFEIHDVRRFACR
ncbi:DUF4405 domain-containing protein, partial [Myxococcota bacterium]